eukprot:163854-Ditylum_brightwellii.AAC.1
MLLCPGPERKKGGALRGGPIDVGDSASFAVAVVVVVAVAVAVGLCRDCGTCKDDCGTCGDGERKRD